MNRFDYIRAGSTAEAIAAVAEPGAAYLAAGANLLDLMKGRIVQPTRLVDITRLRGLDSIENLPDGSPDRWHLRRADGGWARSLRRGG